MTNQSENMSTTEEGNIPGMSEEAAAEAFLRRHGMFCAQLDMEAELKKLLGSMEDGFPGGGRSGRMIPTYIGDYRAPLSEKRVTVIDIGGTNVRCAVLVMGPEGVREIVDLITFLTPGVEEETDTAHFYGRIAEGTQKNLVTDEIGICFSLATIPQRDRDAVMVAGGKQIKIRDMLGKKVGESFRQAMAQLGLDRGQRITVVNDTVAAALGGQADARFRAVLSEPGRISGKPGQEKNALFGIASCEGLCDTCDTAPPGAAGYSSHMGFIYGTGINLCYREKSGEWVNTEAAAYNGLPTGDLDDVFDRGLIDTGCDRLEKMVSGGYQGGLMDVVLKAAAEEGVITRETYQGIYAGTGAEAGVRGAAQRGVTGACVSGNGQADPAVFRVEPDRESLTARDISVFAKDPHGKGRMAAACACDRDRSVMAAICEAMTERSACICALVLTAGLLRSGAGRDPERPVFITAEGSTYLKQKGFKEKLQQRMDEFAGAGKGLHFEFHVVPDVILKGIAVACLSE